MEGEIKFSLDDLDEVESQYKYFKNDLSVVDECIKILREKLKKSIDRINELKQSNEIIPRLKF